MKATRLEFEKNYSDDSGPAISVKWDAHACALMIEADGERVEISMDRFDWLMSVLSRIDAEVNSP